MSNKEDEEKDEFKIIETDEAMDKDEIGLRALKVDFLNCVHSRNGINYDLAFMTAEEFGIVEDYTYAYCRLLQKDPVLKYLMDSVCRRFEAYREAYFALPTEMENSLREDPPVGVILLEKGILYAGLRLVRRLGYRKRGFNREMCVFLMEKGLMTEEEYASFMNLRDYAEEACTVLIMTDLHWNDILPCLTLYTRLVSELFRKDIEGRSKR